MKTKLFLCVLCLALFADGLLPQTAPVDEAARLTQVEMMQKQQGEAVRSIADDLGQIKRNSRTEFMWSVGLVLAIFVAGYALVHQMRTQFSDFMAKMLDMHLQMVATMAELQGKLNQLQGEMAQFRSDVDAKITNLQGEMNAKFVDLQTDVAAKMSEVQTDMTAKMSEVQTEVTTKMSEVQTDVAAKMADLQSDVTTKMSEVQTDVTAKMADLRGDVSDVKADLRGDLADVKADLRGDVSDVKIDVGGLKKDVAIIQKDLVDGIDAHVAEVERSTNAQFADIREILAKQQETESEPPKMEMEADSTD